MREGPSVPDQKTCSGRHAQGNGAVSEEVANLLRAVESRDVIGQAKGILMERYKLTADEAFDRLRERSQHSNRKVVELAKLLAETGEWAADPEGADM